MASPTTERDAKRERHYTILFRILYGVLAIDVVLFALLIVKDAVC